MATVAGPWKGNQLEDLGSAESPKSIQAEEGTLGGLLTEPQFLPEVMKILRGPEDFFRDQHQCIYRGILDLHAAGLAIDGTTICDWLERNGYWKEIGEEDAINHLVQNTPNSANTIYYAQIVREKALLRDAIQVGSDAQRDGYSGALTSEQVIARLRQKVELLEGDVPTWPEPNLDGMPAAEPFPLDALPDPLKQFVMAASASFPCPPDFVALPCLAVAAGAIGRSVALQIKESWSESPSLYVAFCSPPGSTKSAALKVAIRPLMEIQEDELDRHQLAVSVAKATKRSEDEARKKAGKAAETDLVLPKLLRTMVSDTTVEKLAVILSENPRGVTMIHDELTAWLDGMGQYKQGGGNDRQFFLSAWAGAAVSIDRKNQENGVPLFLSHPSLSIAGAMTPDMLRPCLDNGGKEDGFLDRILVGFPDAIEIRFTDATIPEDLSSDWGDAVKRLWGRAMVSNESRDHPYFVRFTKWGQERFRDWFDDHCKESEQDDFPRHLRGPWAKLRGYCARIALVIEMLDAAFDPIAPEIPRNVSIESLNRAILIIDYFKNHARRVHFLIQGSTIENPDARVILNWAAGRESNRFSEREVRDCFRRRRSKTFLAGSRDTVLPTSNGAAAADRGITSRRNPLRSSARY